MGIVVLVNKKVKGIRDSESGFSVAEIWNMRINILQSVYFFG